MVINIQDDLLKIHGLGLLDKLLADKTTKKNIMWATDAYRSFGAGYGRNEAITPDLITGPNSGVIKTRARKATEQQSERTRRHAEVFTPLWICRKMNDHADEVWFGSEEVFFREGKPVPTAAFPPGKSWKKYVDSRQLEITCGEAPYLVSRYDMETGGMIPIPKRIGLLDRKLRVVSENARDEAEWLEWAVRAFQAAYGFEFQGDNVLLARVNLLMTFEEYLQDRWKREPSKAEWRKVVNIATWNVWQMNGLTGTVPYGTAEEKFREIDWFGMFHNGEKERQANCRIFNWRAGQSVEYRSLQKKEDRAFQFCCIIGNPPYQEADGGSGASARPIYNKFIESAKRLSPEVLSLIIPAKWYSGGKGLDEFRREMLNDSHISRLVDYTDSADCFPGVDVAGGICYFVWDKNYNGKCKYTNNYHGITATAERDLGEYDTFIRYPEAVSIIAKVKALHETTLDNTVSSRKPFGLDTKARPASSGDIELRYHGGVGPFRSTDIKTGADMIDQWKIIISYLTAEHAGQPDKNGQFRVLSTVEKLKPRTVCSETYLVAGAFDTQSEADNFMSYLKTRFARFLLAQIAVTQHISRAAFAFVPAQDFTKPVSEPELYRKYKLTEEEISFVERMIKKFD